MPLFSSRIAVGLVRSSCFGSGMGLEKAPAVSYIISVYLPPRFSLVSAMPPVTSRITLGLVSVMARCNLRWKERHRENGEREREEREYIHIYIYYIYIYIQLLSPLFFVFDSRSRQPERLLVA
jgi:hypothetical protein